MLSSLQTRLAGRPLLVQPGERVIQPLSETYRDAPAATLTRVITQIRQGQPWREAVRTEFATHNPWLCNIITHPARSRFFEEHPPKPDSLILDIGAGWGQTTLPLAVHSQVVAVEPTPERLDFIMAAAEQEKLRAKIFFVQASFLDLEFEPIFDYACCIGVLEWVAQFHRSGDPRAVQLSFLRRLRAALKPGGRCYLGIENRLGLKYLLGARDDHTGIPLVSVFDAQLAATKYQSQTGSELRVFTRSLAEYEGMFREAGFASISTFAAFPDYKLPAVILPLDDLEQFNSYVLREALPPEHDGIDGRLLPNQEEHRSHYRSLAQMGIAQCFAPSYFFVLE